MGRMFNPPHPGESIREDVLPALGVTVTDAAKQLGVARVTLSRPIAHMCLSVLVPSLEFQGRVTRGDFPTHTL
jgi:hypothetical protein